MPFDPSAVSKLVPRLAASSALARDARAEHIRRLQLFWQPGFDLEVWLRQFAAANKPGQSAAASARFVPGTLPSNVFETAGVESEDYVLITCDGSQIMPDRHASALFAMLQSACVVLQYGLGGSDHPSMLTAAIAALQIRKTKFYSDDELWVDGDLVSPATLSNERDVQEIEHLAETAESLAAAGGRVVALADGSLMPFALITGRLPQQQATAMAERITVALTRLRDSRALVAGYVDRPGSNTLAMSLAHGCYGAAMSQGVRAAVANLADRHIVEGVTPVGHRTALFEPGWASPAIAHVAAAGHGFVATYLNVSKYPHKPYIARIEVPTWCASRIPELHAIVQRHCDASVGDPYPFCLKAAHECAVITREDQREIAQFVDRALLNEGILPAMSAKQSAKDLG